jgi:hypothetical protein
MTIAVRTSWPDAASARAASASSTAAAVATIVTARRRSFSLVDRMPTMRLP